ncbi:MAG: SDR family oxidoreductase [Phascolarctobacterium sp.]|nr:SDR family oxidoreductase [Candidatus Phascolarctobacterium caballi]
MSKVQFDFTNENFVVTGASSGMGKQIAVELAEAGAKVLAIARRENELSALHNQYPNIIPSMVDVCDYATMENVINNFVKQYGKLNGGIYAAGITGLTPLRSYDEKEVQQIIDISFIAGAKFMQITSKKKNSVDGASFVWFSSECARGVASGLFAYAGTKAACEVAARTFAKELASRKIRVNTVSPGWVKTNMTKNLGDTHNMEEIAKESLFGFGEAQDVSGMVLFLLSDRAKWITGTNISVAGGFGI